MKAKMEICVLYETSQQSLTNQMISYGLGEMDNTHLNKPNPEEVSNNGE